MKELIMIVAFVVVAFLVGRTEISFSPFYIRMDGWMNVVGYLLIGIGLGFLGYDSYERGMEKGFEKSVDHVIQYAKEKTEEKTK